MLEMDFIAEFAARMSLQVGLVAVPAVLGRLWEGRRGMYQGLRLGVRLLAWTAPGLGQNFYSNCDTVPA